MRISAKCRYGIAALIALTYHGSNLTSIFKISEQLEISKIYLEQVFGKLKHAGIITSVKGSAGGYKLAKNAKDISLAEIVFALEDGFSETSYETVRSAPEIDNVISEVFTELDAALRKKLSEISLESLSQKAIAGQSEQTFMFYI
ncbi:MAG: Rrf2 family transcriptional regulator [Ruminococcus sp.]|jgi:Rrf2 family protein|nr:Rrf2 family transcriptional regulator [Ruminococcus sp.]